MTEPQPDDLVPISFWAGYLDVSDEEALALVRSGDPRIPPTLPLWRWSDCLAFIRANSGAE